MAANRPKMGRPRRREGIKRLKLREATFNLWNERKEALGLRRITNSEFAEMLLHQHFSALQEVRVRLTRDLTMVVDHHIQHLLLRGEVRKCF